MAIQLKPDYAAAFCNLGYALLQEGRRAEAMAAYNKALELDPRYALAHNDLGNILLQLGRDGRLHPTISSGRRKSCPTLPRPASTSRKFSWPGAAGRCD